MKKITLMCIWLHCWMSYNYFGKGLCLGRDKAKGVTKVQIARFAYVGNS